MLQIKKEGKLPWTVKPSGKKKKKHKSYGWSNILPNPRPCSFLSSSLKFLYKKKTTNKEGTLIITLGRRNVWHNKVLELVHTFCHSHGEREREKRKKLVLVQRRQSRRAFHPPMFSDWLSFLSALKILSFDALYSYNLSLSLPPFLGQCSVLTCATAFNFNQLNGLCSYAIFIFLFYFIYG